MNRIQSPGDEESTCNPLNLLEEDDTPVKTTAAWQQQESTWSLPVIALLPLLVLVASSAVGMGGQVAWAGDIFDPSQFQPVCPASDGVYNILKVTANTLVGSENVSEYGPLIASVLLRIRLELCLLESFLYEAVIPFIQKKRSLVGLAVP